MYEIRREGGRERESGMMIYKSKGVGMERGSRCVERGKKKDRAKGRGAGERKRLEEDEEEGGGGSCPVWKRDKPAPGKTRCECTLRLLVYVL